MEIKADIEKILQNEEGALWRISGKCGDKHSEEWVSKENEKEDD